MAIPLCCGLLGTPCEVSGHVREGLKTPTAKRPVWEAALIDTSNHSDCCDSNNHGSRSSCRVASVIVVASFRIQSCCWPCTHCYSDPTSDFSWITMQRWILAGVLLLACSATFSTAQSSSSVSSSATEWTDFWGTVVDYYNESLPSSNRKMHRHLLQSSAASAAASAMSSAEDNWNNIFNTLISSNWSKLEPTALQNFNWSSLGDFEVTTPLADLLQDILDKGIPTSEDQVIADVDLLVNALCEPDTFKLPKKSPASCSGPTVTLELQPHECLLDEMTKKVTCKPAQLVLIKTPGSCSHKYESGVEFEGKECKVEKTVGFSKNSTQGGAIDIIPLDWSKLIPVSSDDSSSAMANATATAGK